MKSTRCKFCGISFTFPPEFGNVKYCSSRCRVTHSPPVEPWEYKGCHGTNYYGKSRRRKMKAGDRVDYLVIYQHYDWECYLCNEEIDRNLIFPDPGCATIDHKVELQDGGRHEWRNLFPTHLACHEAKTS